MKWWVALIAICAANAMELSFEYLDQLPSEIIPSIFMFCGFVELTLLGRCNCWWNAFSQDLRELKYRVGGYWNLEMIGDECFDDSMDGWQKENSQRFIKKIVNYEQMTKAIFERQCFQSFPHLSNLISLEPKIYAPLLRLLLKHCPIERITIGADYWFPVMDEILQSQINFEIDDRQLAEYIMCTPGFKPKNLLMMAENAEISNLSCFKSFLENGLAHSSASLQQSHMALAVHSLTEDTKDVFLSLLESNLDSFWAGHLIQLLRFNRPTPETFALIMAKLARAGRGIDFPLALTWMSLMYETIDPVYFLHFWNISEQDLSIEAVMSGGKDLDSDRTEKLLIAAFLTKQSEEHISAMLDYLPNFQMTWGKEIGFFMHLITIGCSESLYMKFLERPAILSAVELSGDLPALMIPFLVKARATISHWSVESIFATFKVLHTFGFRIFPSILLVSVQWIFQDRPEFMIELARLFVEASIITMKDIEICMIAYRESPFPKFDYSLVAFLFTALTGLELEGTGGYQLILVTKEQCDLSSFAPLLAPFFDQETIEKNLAILAKLDLAETE